MILYKIIYFIERHKPLKEEIKMNTATAPKLCLKIGVPRALVNGIKTDLSTCPTVKDGKTLIPAEALAMAGIAAGDGYVDVKEIKDGFVYENEMGLILIDDKEDVLSLSSGKDKKYLLSLAHEFIFEVPYIKITAKDYAPATPEEREGYVALGTKVRELLLARNNTHPFLFGNKDVFDKLRAIYESKDGSDEYNYILSLIKRADERFDHFPRLNENGDGLSESAPASGYGETEYDVGGRHSNSESLLGVLEHEAFAYQITGDDSYAKHTYYCALGIIDRLHWGPGHFLNCSGAAGKLAMIYDWLYDAWNRLGLDTARIKDGLYRQGPHHGYNSVINDACDFPSPKQGTGWRFKLKADNWNSVCNSGMILSSLCLLNDGIDEVITEERYEKLTELIGGCLTSTMQPHLVMTQYAPDGSYVESNSYWAYGTVNLMNSMAALYDSLGTDLGLHNACGLDRTCYYAIYSESPKFVGWNYHDGSLSSQNTSSFNQFAVISGDDTLFALRQSQLKGGKGVALLDMMYHPVVRNKAIPPLAGLPLDYLMVGIDAFAVRSGWTPDALYAGMIGGENPEGGSHNQLDSGAFVYHNKGKMWFTDLGSDYYNSVGIENKLGYFSNYALYRRNAEGNNCLCLESLPYGQLMSGRGVTVESSSSDTASYAIIDNASVYGEDKVRSAKRGILLTNSRRTVIIKDEAELVNPEDAFICAHFESDKITADISECGKKCTLAHKDGERIFVRIDGDGSLEVMDCQGLLNGTAPAEGEYSRENYSRLVVRYKGVESINTAFIIDTEDEEFSCPDMEMWKTL